MANSQEWYTPPEVIQWVLNALGHIDLDPCANAARSVPATTHYVGALGHDGLALPWGIPGTQKYTVMANVPWGDPGPWVDKAVAEYAKGAFTECILIMPARTATRWFKRLARYPMCMPNSRVRYLREESGVLVRPGSGKEDTVFFYIGRNQHRFIEAFSDVGRIYACLNAA